MLQTYSDWFDLMRVFEEGKRSGEAQKGQSIAVCLVHRINAETSREEFLVVSSEQGESYLISGEIGNFEMGVQAARREILAKSGLVCVEKLELLLVRQARDLPGIVDVGGEYQVYGVEVSFLQSSLFETEGSKLRWVEGVELMEVCRGLSPARAELVYQSLRKLGYDEAYFVD